MVTGGNLCLSDSYEYICSHLHTFTWTRALRVSRTLTQSTMWAHVTLVGALLTSFWTGSCWFLVHSLCCVLTAIGPIFHILLNLLKAYYEESASSLLVIRFYQQQRVNARVHVCTCEHVTCILPQQHRGLTVLPSICGSTGCFRVSTGGSSGNMQRPLRFPC